MILKKLLIASSLILTFATAHAQDPMPNPNTTTTVVSRPDLPGHFLFDLGLNSGINPPEKAWKKGFWGSRTVNLYYYHPIRLGSSKFSLNPGIGFSMERFKFTNFYLLKDTLDNVEQYDLIPNRVYPGLKKSQLVMNYLEIPLEFRFDANPSDPSRTFWASVGGRFGMNINTHTKIKFKEDGEMNYLKERWRHGVSKFRYSVGARFGVGGFGWFVYYNLTPLFETEKGPSKTEMSVLTAGITINGF